MNPSLSITLKEALTSTRMRYHYDPAIREPEIQFRFEGKKTPSFEERVCSFIKGLKSYIPAVAHVVLEIDSSNTFPHSSGIASSASAMGALALCLVQMEREITGNSDSQQMLRKASFIARLGSGSASRSIYPAMSLWGKADQWTLSSNEYAIPVTGYHDVFRRMRDTILIVESAEKKVSSSAGHSLMDANPFSRVRFRQVRANLSILHSALSGGDWQGFLRLMEEEALSLHAMMMTSRPSYILMQPATLSIIHKVRAFRKDTGNRLGFTLDAGANVHLLYAEDDAEAVDRFIRSELTAYCEDGRVISDRMGNGPEIIRS